MSGRPPTVRAAVAVLVLLAGATLVSTVRLLVLGAARPGSPVLGLPHRLGVVLLCGRLAVVALDLVLAALVRRGGRAARVVLTVWSTCGAVAFVAGTARGGLAGQGPFAVVAFVLNVAILVLLWLPASWVWFRRRS